MQIYNMILCEYGCGKEAKFKTKAGKNICESSPNKCIINKKKNSEALKKGYKNGNIKIHLPQSWDEKRRWRSFKTKEEIEQSLLKRRKTIEQKKLNGEWKNIWEGKKHKKESIEKISKSTSKRLEIDNQIRNKYKVFCPYKKDIVNVTAGWELKFAHFLNENKINWDKSNNYNFAYIDDNNIKRTYYPDFYLPDYNLFIEIKGANWAKVFKTTGGVDDVEKVKRVIKDNNVKISILWKEDLKELGILI